MPAFKRKAKSVTCCLSEGTCPHVCRKSSKMSMNTSTQVRVYDDTAELDTSNQNGYTSSELSQQEVERNEQSGHEEYLWSKTANFQKFPSFADCPASDERMDLLSNTSPPNLETIFSPTMDYNGVHYKESAQCSGGIESDLDMPQLTADGVVDGGDSSSDYTVFCSSDISGDLPNGGILGFSDSLLINLSSDFECAALNMMFNVTQSCMMLPPLEESVETTHFHSSGPCEDFWIDSDDSLLHSMTRNMKAHDEECDVESSHLDSEGQSFDPHLFLKNLPDLSGMESNVTPMLQPKRTGGAKHVTLVLDLDETLIHSTLEPCVDADFNFQVSFDMKEHTVYVRKRPFLHTFLEKVAEMFEIVIFTASQKIYAEQLLDRLDPSQKLISQRAYRDSCIFSDGSHTKDLTILGVDLAKVAIIDNSPQVFRLQVDNGIPIESWFDDPSDQALLLLLPFLETLVDADDVRPLIAKKFGVKE